MYFSLASLSAITQLNSSTLSTFALRLEVISLDIRFLFSTEGLSHYYIKFSEYFSQRFLLD